MTAGVPSGRIQQTHDAHAEPHPMLTVYIDADACPVKDEVYRVARRYALRVAVVANTSMRVPARAPNPVETP